MCGILPLSTRWTGSIVTGHSMQLAPLTVSLDDGTFAIKARMVGLGQFCALAVQTTQNNNTLNLSGKNEFAE